MKKKLAIDIADLMLAYESSWDGSTSYLDVETGEVLHFSDEIHYEAFADCDADDSEESSDSADEDEVVDEDAEEESPSPAWMVEARQQFRKIQAGLGTRYLDIPQSDSHEAYRMMVDFIHSVEDKPLRRFLEIAIQGQGAFRRFKEVLLDYPEERERWFKFKDDSVREEVLYWLEAEGIEPIEG